MVAAGVIALGASAADNFYNESADAKAELQSAVITAAKSGKDVLVVFGANWCGDCKVLDMEMKKGELAKLVGGSYVVVKVDVGRFDRNTGVADSLGVPLKKGIPSIAVLDSGGKPRYITNGGELADARNIGGVGLVKFFSALPASN
jgi:protein disulfide-isomerase